MMKETEDLIMKMSADERQRRYEYEKNRLLEMMKGHTALEIQEALKALIEKWRV